MFFKAKAKLTQYIAILGTLLVNLNADRINNNNNKKCHAAPLLTAMQTLLKYPFNNPITHTLSLSLIHQCDRMLEPFSAEFR